MILTLEYNVSKLFPGQVVFSKHCEVDKEDIDLFYKCKDLLTEKKSDIRNSIWQVFNDLDKKIVINKYQKYILECLAIYCDIYPESIHSIQWQEKINIIVNKPGENEKTFNPSRSFVESDGYINNAPFNRQLVVELYLDTDYEGGHHSFEYIDLNNYKPESGDIVIYPASFLWSRKEKSIIKGRRMYLRTFFNGGKDFFNEDKDLDLPGTELFFSYMR
jgi:hypothetical protein